MQVGDCQRRDQTHFVLRFVGLLRKHHTRAGKYLLIKMRGITFIGSTLHKQVRKYWLRMECDVGMEK